jgi:hypothetical protein
MTPRTVTAGLTMAAVLAVGCSVGRAGDGDRDPGPAVSRDSAAIDLLRASTAFIDHTSFRTDVEFAGGQMATVAHTDNVHKRADAIITLWGVETEARLVDDDIYLRTDTDMPGVGHGWLVLDPAKVPAGFAMSFAPGKNDPGGSARLIDAVVSAEVSGSGITGTMDLTKVGTGNGISFRPGPGGKFPSAARSTRFEATLDGQHRLTSFVVQSAPDATLRYSEFGAAVSVSRPRGAVPAPAALYPQLGLH